VQGRVWVVVGLFSFAAAARISADDPAVLVPNSAVHKAGSGGAVKVTLENRGSQPLILSGWEVRKGASPVLQAPLQGVGALLQPGQVLSFRWNKRTSNGEWVKSGSYRILAHVHVGAGDPKVFGVTVALTPSGKLAGSNPYPLAVGNKWTYRNQQGVLSISEVTSSSEGGWYRMTNPPAGTGWVAVTGTTYPILWVWDGNTARPFFRFRRPTGTEWQTGLPFYKTLRVAATKVTLANGLGVFKNCSQIGTPPGLSSRSWWFAPGFGTVKTQSVAPNSMSLDGGVKASNPVAVRIRGTDGKWYLVEASHVRSSP